MGNNWNIHSALTPQDWLSTTGSPHSVIERCDFSNERELEGKFGFGRGWLRTLCLVCHTS